jgi:hypothetical protein
METSFTGIGGWDLGIERSRANGRLYSTSVPGCGLAVPTVPLRIPGGIPTYLTRRPYGCAIGTWSGLMADQPHVAQPKEDMPCEHLI